MDISKGDFPSHLAVLTELGQVANTALNEPASLLGTKQLLLLDQHQEEQSPGSPFHHMPAPPTWVMSGGHS